MCPYWLYRSLRRLDYDNEYVRYREVSKSMGCGVTLFYPHPDVLGREPASGQIENEFLEVPILFIF
jgi:hypothetical protein